MGWKGRKMMRKGEAEGKPGRGKKGRKVKGGDKSPAWLSQDLGSTAQDPGGNRRLWTVRSSIHSYCFIVNNYSLQLETTQTVQTPAPPPRLTNVKVKQMIGVRLVNTDI